MKGDADGSAATLPSDALVDGSTSSSGSAIIDAANDARRYVLHRERHLRAALGTYRFFVYAGAPFDAMSSELLLPGYNSTYVGVPGVGIEPSKPLFAEYTAPVWIHRALLSDSSRTLNPDEADLFFVPLYLAISESQPSHTARLTAWLSALQQSPHFQRSTGTDHIIAPQVISPQVAATSGLAQVRKLLELGFTGAFEVNNEWTAGWSWNRTIVMPYVANPFLTPIEAANASMLEYVGRKRNISIYYVASLRHLSDGLAGCNRAKLRDLESYPNAYIRVAKRSYHLVPQDEYASGVQNGPFCPLTCGDTPTSRRTFDAFAAGCVPIIVGRRLFGLCEPPCRNKGWFTVVGPSFPHLPFSGLWMNWSVFPMIEEKELYDQKSSQGVRDLFRGSVIGFGGEDSALRARAYMYTQLRSMIYGWGDYRTSTAFGDASRRMMEAALLRLRRVDVEALPTSKPMN